MGLPVGLGAGLGCGKQWLWGRRSICGAEDPSTGRTGEKDLPMGRRTRLWGLAAAVQALGPGRVQRGQGAVFWGDTPSIAMGRGALGQDRGGPCGVR